MKGPKEYYQHYYKRMSCGIDLEKRCLNPSCGHALKFHRCDAGCTVVDGKLLCTCENFVFNEGLIMKRITALTACLIMLVFALPCMATDLTFMWDPMPAGQGWTNVRIYQVAGTTYTLKGTAAGTATSLTITGFNPGSYIFVARSVAGALESADSNQATKDILPASPTHFLISVTIAPDGSVTFKLIDPNEFFRAKVG